MDYKKGSKLYEGKAKIIYQVIDRSDLVYQEFKDSLTAFNGEKKGSFKSKGHLNRDITSMIFQSLRDRGISNHWVDNVGENGMITQKLKIIPLEVVVRNVVAGSLAKRLGWKEGEKLRAPITEFYFKNDSLGDPMINDDHIQTLKLCDSQSLAEIRKMALLINSELITLFKKCQLLLVDFKLEFGRADNGSILLADEITPDTCRLWDQNSMEKLDKDRFRRDLGNIEEAYLKVHQKVAEHLGKAL